MKRLTLAIVVAMLTLPGSALAATSTGVVKSVNRGHHVITLVDARRAVHTYRYQGRLPKLRAGSHRRK
jgi:hypothetical protein